MGLSARCDLKLIQAGRPKPNVCIDIFNGKFRDECLNEHWFSELNHARDLSVAGEWIAMKTAPTQHWVA
jgi:putative transposase